MHLSRNGIGPQRQGGGASGYGDWHNRAKIDPFVTRMQQIMARALERAMAKRCLTQLLVSTGRIEESGVMVLQVLLFCQADTHRGKARGLSRFALTKISGDIGKHIQQCDALFATRTCGSVPLDRGNGNEVPVFVVEMPRSGSTAWSAQVEKHESC